MFCGSRKESARPSSLPADRLESRARRLGPPRAPFRIASKFRRCSPTARASTRGSWPSHVACRFIGPKPIVDAPTLSRRSRRRFRSLSRTTTTGQGGDEVRRVRRRRRGVGRARAHLAARERVRLGPGGDRLDRRQGATRIVVSLSRRTTVRRGRTVLLATTSKSSRKDPSRLPAQQAAHGRTVRMAPQSRRNRRRGKGSAACFPTRRDGSSSSPAAENNSCARAQVTVKVLSVDTVKNQLALTMRTVDAPAGGGRGGGERRGGGPRMSKSERLEERVKKLEVRRRARAVRTFFLFVCLSRVTSRVLEMSSRRRTRGRALCSSTPRERNVRPAVCSCHAALTTAPRRALTVRPAVCSRDAAFSRPRHDARLSCRRCSTRSRPTS